MPFKIVGPLIINILVHKLHWLITLNAEVRKFTIIFLQLLCTPASWLKIARYKISFFCTVLDTLIW